MNVCSPPSSHKRRFINLKTAGLALVLAMNASVSAKASKVGLVREGEPTAQIVISKTPSEADRFAAVELQNYIERISGAKLPIIESDEPTALTSVVIGNHPLNREVTDALDKKHPSTTDAFAVVADDKQVSLVGRSETATLWSAWELIESMGVRWLLPGKHGTFVPQSKTVEVEKGSLYNAPRFVFRGPHYHIHPDTDPSVPAGFTAKDEHGMSAQRLFNLRMRMNDRNAFVMKEQYANLGLGHSFAEFLPASRYFSEHPEWFNMKNGERQGPDSRFTQICFTNRDAANEFAKNAMNSIKHLIEHHGFTTERIRLCVAPNDAIGDIWTECECENCAKLKDNDGSTTSQIVNFANMVAEEVHKTYPTVPISVYAYLGYSTPPDHVKPGKNVFIELCAWSGNESFGVNHAHPLMSDRNAKFRDSFNKYDKMTDGLSAYTYYGHYNWFGPWPIVNSMVKDIKEFASRPNFYGMISESHLHWGTQGLTFWLHPRLMWNPALDVNAEIKDYCRAAYGPAADAMERYYTTLNAAMDSQGYIAGAIEEVASVLTPEIIAKCNAFISEAEAKMPEMDEDMRWRTNLATSAWRNSAKFAEALHLLTHSQNYADREVIMRKVNEVHDYSKTDTGKWAFEYLIAKTQFEQIANVVKLDARALPKGEHSHASGFVNGSVFRLYGKVDGFRPQIWGYELSDNEEGVATVELRAEKGSKLKSLEIGWGLTDIENYEAELYLTTDKGEKKKISDDAAAMKKGVKVPDDLLGEGVTLELAVKANKGGLILHSWNFKAEVE